MVVYNLRQYTFPIVSPQGVAASLLKRQSRGIGLENVEVRDVEFLRANIGRTIKITLPGPFTMSRQAKNEFL